MQSLFLKPSFKTNGKRLSRILTEHGISTPTPARKRYLCIFETEHTSPLQKVDVKLLTCSVVHKEFRFYDGYCVKGVRGIYKLSGKLVLFLDTVMQQYQLKDYEAIFLLNFLEANLVEACRQVCDGNGTTKHKLRMDIDAPWQLDVKPICQQPGITQFTQRALFKDLEGRTFAVRKHFYRSVLMQAPIFEIAAGRCLRIQRCFYADLQIHVACVLADNLLSLEITGLLFPKLLREYANYRKLMSDLEMCLLPLVLASKSWHIPNGKDKSTPNSEQVDILLSLKRYLVRMSSGRHIILTDNDLAAIAKNKRIFVVLQIIKGERKEHII